MKYWSRLLMCVLAMPMVLSAQELSDAAKVEFFDQKVYAILKDNCFKCHGGEKKLKGQFRLTSREGLLAGGEIGPAINLKEPQKSLLLDMLSYRDGDHEMPPKAKLPQAQIDILTQWVKLGAPFNPKLEIAGNDVPHKLPNTQINARTKAYWAYQKIEHPPTPKVANDDWGRSAIDAFVFDRLARNKLTPNGPADRRQLIRRAYYDLIGLPPSPEEVATFIKDSSPNAFGKVIDRLLAMPQYGEKWGRHWLDLVRFAETNGYERDSKKDLIWKYRDYVIRAFNEDKPYDRFIMEQIAGDELPDKTGDSITATGFYRLGIWDDEPADRPLARYDYLDDILRTASETFLGMTVGCARCHDHKIDPIPQKDYYSLLSFFSDISPHGKGKTNHVPITGAKAKAEMETKRAGQQKQIQHIRAKIDPIEEQLLDELAKKNPSLRDKAPKDTKKLNNPYALPDASRGKGQIWEYTFAKPGDNWFEIAFDDQSWEKDWSGFGTRGTPGSHVRTEWRTSDIWLRKDFRLVEIPGKLVLRIHHDEDAQVYMNGKLVKTLTGHSNRYIDMDITEASLDVLQTGRNTIAIHCKQTTGGQYIDAGLLVDYNITPVPLLARLHGKAILGDVKLAEYNQLHQQLTTLEQQKLEVKEEFAMAVGERGRQKTWVLKRGNPQLQGEEVVPAFPQILGTSEVKIPEGYDTGKTSGKRRVLADWIASKNNPMTAKVMANRLWQHHFGRGIVRSSNNFGHIGDQPTHPELLNWLAAELVDGGWKLKRMHKLIMMSRTYQMASSGNQAALAADPNNDFFWRFDMRRLAAEEIRDSILTLTGELNLKMTGPSIYTEIPAEVAKTASRPGAAWGRSSKEDAVRRSVYIFVKRSLHEPFLASFDWADTDNTCDVRFVTTVPTQTLTMMNSKFLNDSAEKLAARLEKEQPNDTSAQVIRAITLATSRPATKEDVADGLKLIEHFTKNGIDRNKALQRFCLLVLNLNEFVYLD
ncbi:PSD1 and planctomycete cytochrome C domain-containing protein [Verrucomicrobia bacterium]|nr:PSD1 and planctomycete cytochrome C domain-containing protein [Verrucomicrobiota bacterium]